MATKFAVSNDESNRSFSNILDSKIENEIFICEEDDWTTFLKDHEMLIRKHSEWVEFDKETAYRYRYRMREYLKDKKNYNPSMVMAFRIVNRFYHSYDFDTEVEGFYIPDQKYINELRSIYATNKSVQAKL